MCGDCRVVIMTLYDGAYSVYGLFFPGTPAPQVW